LHHLRTPRAEPAPWQKGRESMEPMQPILGGEKATGKEGKTTREIEQVTARAPSAMWLWLAGGAIATSLGLFLAGKREAGIFVGLWPLTFLVMGNYNKIVKTMGSTGENVKQPALH
jgi:hypothetical protein